MKRFLITVSALSLLAAPTLSLAQDRGGDRDARRAARQAERAAQGGGEQRSPEERAQRREDRQERQADRQDGGDMSELQRRDAAARAEAEENLRRVEAGQPRVGEDRVRRADERAFGDGREDRQERRQDRREDRRDDRQDDRQDRREDRQESRQDRREDRRDYRDDRRDDRRDYRQDRRARNFQYRGRSYQSRRAPIYRWAPGYRSRSWAVGAFLPAPLVVQSYILRDFWSYDLPPPPRGTYYVRVDTDVYLVTYRGNRVVDVIRGVFYYDDYGW